MDTTTKQSTKRQGGDSRGSSYARRARKTWLLKRYGNGETCPCTWCGETLTFATLESDRIIPGAAGGCYSRINCQPSCRHCNAQRGDLTVEEFRAVLEGSSK